MAKYSNAANARKARLAAAEEASKKTQPVEQSKPVAPKQPAPAAAPVAAAPSPASGKKNYYNPETSEKFIKEILQSGIRETLWNDYQFSLKNVINDFREKGDYQSYHILMTINKGGYLRIPGADRIYHILHIKNAQDKETGTYKKVVDYSDAYTVTKVENKNGKISYIPQAAPRERIEKTLQELRIPEYLDKKCIAQEFLSNGYITGVIDEGRVRDEVAAKIKSGELPERAARDLANLWGVKVVGSAPNGIPLVEDGAKIYRELLMMNKLKDTRGNSPATVYRDMMRGLDFKVDQEDLVLIARGHTVNATAQNAKGEQVSLPLRYSIFEGKVVPESWVCPALKHANYQHIKWGKEAGKEASKGTEKGAEKAHEGAEELQSNLEADASMGLGE